jgi:hypothetical protein
VEVGFCAVLPQEKVRGWHEVSATVGEVSATVGQVSATAGELSATAAGEVSATVGEVSATVGQVSATAGELSATAAGELWATAGELWATAGELWATAGKLSATAGASRESGSKDTHLDPVLARGMRPLGAKPVEKRRGFGSTDTPLVPHEQEFVFLSTSRCTGLKRNAVRPEIVSMGQEREETQHIGTAANGSGALIHHRQENDENRPHHGDVIRPDVKRNFRFGPLRRGKLVFRLIKNLLYCRVDSVCTSTYTKPGRYLGLGKRVSEFWLG